MGKWAEQKFFKGRINGQSIHEAMLNIPGHKGIANEKHMKISTHSNQNSYPQEHK
jgi:hypothetical protein